ncbi:hypothetical protein [Shewanella sp. GD03713]|uniref:hypothetical protein n=1 Tax=Shewanella sp. GD03713 TaxID=2975372 RepID=UPI000F702E4D|nr:hypothetical protein [Shewanella sp. GD03713]MDH1468665.1 hypothetical protein [Shewanella sp. GD03713]VEE62376.1 Uncharacterised protein [Shewanella putrefaciens]
MLKKWIAILLPVAVLGLSGCASVSDTDTDSTVASSVEKKVSKKGCDKVTSTGSRIGRCK